MQRFATVLGLCLAIVLAACSGGAPPGAVPAPSYGIGDSYRFDDGTTRTVIAVEGDRIIWRGAPHTTIVTTSDVMLPPVAETTLERHIQRLVVSGGLFPLTPGKESVFRVSPDADAGKNHIEQSGTCTVGNRTRLSTPAGSFDTIRVTCVLRQPGRGVIMRRTFFYAPSIAYYVRRDEQIGDGPVHRIRLVHFAPGNPVLPDSALRRRTAAIQSALESKESNTVLRWNDPASDAAGSIEPMHPEHSPRFGWCREFREHLRVTARDYDLVGTACRSSGGTWLVREITPFRAPS